jgi:hypothetical protein
MSIPNPGSQAALDLGCKCPVMDNNHGKFAPWHDERTGVTGWWFNLKCAIHGTGDWEGKDGA